MSAPSWIAEALEEAIGRREPWDEITRDLTKALIERMPLEAMTRAIAMGTDGPAIIARVVDAMIGSGPETATAMTRPDSAPTWELVHDVAFERVRRMRVPLGWLYQTEIDQLHSVLRVGEDDTRVIGWHPPIFVPNIHDDGATP